MKLVKLVTTIALLLFVGATVGVLIAQEVSYTAAESTGIEPSGSSSGATDAATSVATSTQSAMPDVPETDAHEPQDFAASDSTDVESDAPSTAAGTPDAQPECVVDAIYFHNTLRCRTCKAIEATARAVLEAQFSEEFATGDLRWSAVNMEEQRHFVDEFELVKPTLILVRSVADQQMDWVALDETWSLIGSELKFGAYIERATRAFLEDCP